MKLMGRMALCAGLLLLAGGGVSAETIATFADPSPSGGTPVLRLAGDTLSYGWSTSDLLLEVPLTGKAYPNAILKASDLTVVSTIGPLKIMSGGKFDFFDQDGNQVLEFSFDSASLYTPFSFGASDLTADNVKITGPGIPGGLIDEHFAFSLANQVKTADGYTWTAAFTSSATIPEPGAFGLLSVGLFGLLRRR